MGKVHGSLARAGKVKSQVCPSYSTQMEWELIDSVLKSRSRRRRSSLRDEQVSDLLCGVGGWMDGYGSARIGRRIKPRTANGSNRQERIWINDIATAVDIGIDGLLE